MSQDADSRFVVCDASPIIFLAKVNLLQLMDTIPGGDCVVLELVANELLSGQADPIEKSRIENWLNKIRIVSYSGQIIKSQALSASDHASLSWAVKNKADWMIADERLLRRFARDKGIKVIGFCGILIKAVSDGILPADQARQALDETVGRDALRLSLPVYQAALRHLEAKH